MCRSRCETFLRKTVSYLFELHTVTNEPGIHWCTWQYSTCLLMSSLILKKSKVSSIMVKLKWNCSDNRSKAFHSIQLNNNHMLDIWIEHTCKDTLNKKSILHLSYITNGRNLDCVEFQHVSAISLSLKCKIDVLIIDKCNYTLDFVVHLPGQQNLASCLYLANHWVQLYIANYSHTACLHCSTYACMQIYTIALIKQLHYSTTRLLVCNHNWLIP